MKWEKRRARLLRSLWGRRLLWLLSMAYGAGVLVRGLLYDLRVLKSRRVNAKVICIGNLTTGGTGNDTGGADPVPPGPPCSHPEPGLRPREEGRRGLRAPRRLRDGLEALRR
jgi:hypothetical protein